MAASFVISRADLMLTDVVARLGDESSARADVEQMLTSRAQS